MKRFTEWYVVRRPHLVVAVVTAHPKSRVADGMFWMHNRHVIDHYADIGVRVTCDKYDGDMSIPDFRVNWRIPHFWPPHAFTKDCAYWSEL